MDVQLNFPSYFSFIEIFCEDGNNQNSEVVSWSSFDHEPIYDEYTLELENVEEGYSVLDTCECEFNGLNDMFSENKNPISSDSQEQFSVDFQVGLKVKEVLINEGPEYMSFLFDMNDEELVLQPTLFSCPTYVSLQHSYETFHPIYDSHHMEVH